jgi:DNA polymerase-3 subunit gamma/tau
MTYKSLYRTYRPNSFETVVGQRHIIQTLQNAIKQKKMSHAYLFCGPRGTGKTTVAKLLAKSVNCINVEQAPCNQCEHCLTIQNGTHPDVIEIDAASNNGVDEIRDLIEKVKYAPLQGKYKVYIVDEVHMLSQGAFNALLKTLEEPPAHVIFILATTEPHKVLPTIISRCQRYDFVRVNRFDIQMRIEEVLKAEKIEYEEEAVRLISQLADGGVRDALSILEQCIAYSGQNLNAQHVNDIYGIATTQDKLKLLNAVIDNDVTVLMQEIDYVTGKNIDIRRLTNDLMELLKESVVYSFTKDKSLLNKLTEEEVKSLNRLSAPVGLKMIEDLMETLEKYRSASNLLSYFEIGLLKLISHTVNKIEEPKVKFVEKVVETKPIYEEAVAQDEPELALVEEQIEEEKVAPKPKENKKKMAQIVQNDDFSLDFLVQLFVSGDKAKRKQIEHLWSNLQNYQSDLAFGKIANLLMDIRLVALNEGFMVLSHSEDYVVNELNMEDNQALIEDFTERVFGLRMRAYAVLYAKSEEAMQYFVQLRSENRLPDPIKFNKVEKTVEKKVDSVEKNLFDLFGQENVEII